MDLPGCPDPSGVRDRLGSASTAQAQARAGLPPPSLLHAFKGISAEEGHRTLLIPARRSVRGVLDLEQYGTKRSEKLDIFPFTSYMT